jgi:hypothetical protein
MDELRVTGEGGQVQQVTVRNLLRFKIDVFLVFVTAGP